MVIPLSGFDFLPPYLIYTPLYKFSLGKSIEDFAMVFGIRSQAQDVRTGQTTTQIDPSGRAITVEAINDIWFLLVALVAVIVYCVRIEVSVKDLQRRIQKVEEESIPELHREIREVEMVIEKTMTEARRVCGVEFHAAIASQREFIEGQTALVLEKIANIKEQTDRQGREMREFGGMLSCQKRNQAQVNND